MDEGREKAGGGGGSKRWGGGATGKYTVINPIIPNMHTKCVHTKQTEKLLNQGGNEGIEHSNP